MDDALDHGASIERRKTFTKCASPGLSELVSLRGNRIEKAATLPDGRQALVRIGVPDDPYIPRRELDTVDVELVLDGRVAAAVNTILEPEQEHEASVLAREIVAGLESGSLEPTAGALEPLADSLPS